MSAANTRIFAVRNILEQERRRMQLLLSPYIEDVGSVPGTDPTSTLNPDFLQVPLSHASLN
jgi:hypothetical protein